MRVSTLIMTAALSLIPMFPAWAANQPASSAAAAHPITHQLNTRLRSQWMLVQQGLKSGKLTKEQANTLKTSLRSVRQQEVSFLKESGNHDLTSAQLTQLNTLLDKNSSAIGETVPVGQ